MKVLSKSRFKVGLECPNKLHYVANKEYHSLKLDDPFLKALAEGGFQVEELARMHYPNGYLIDGDMGDYIGLHNETAELLKKENVIIYEAAFLVDNLFVRTDVLVKKGNRIELVEVKAKSFRPDDEHLFIGAKGGMKSGWKSYLFDIAFQKFVMQKCNPHWDIVSFILMADKTKVATVDGLNQMFRISKKGDGRTGVLKKVTSLKETGTKVLSTKNVSEIVAGIECDKYMYHPNLTFYQSIEFLKRTYVEGSFAGWPTSFSQCRSCEFKCTEEQERGGVKSGFKNCFTELHNWGANDFKKPNTLGIWNFRKGSKLFEENVVFMAELTPEMIGLSREDPFMSISERHWVQIEKKLNNDNDIYVLESDLKDEIGKWVYPLHFIDFETSASSLPFHKGRRPYEQVAFQFSHHIYNDDGTVEHRSEYLNSTAGEFPNFKFVRQLKIALDNDNGSVFRYSNHENSILNAIYWQLNESDENDKLELQEFIQSISHSTKKSPLHWKGERDMVDLWDVVKKYYYNPLTEGSNSIKDVLPAVLEKSDFLQEKYSQSLDSIRLTSKNFNKDHIWLKIEKGRVINPYKMLPQLFSAWTEEQIEETLSEIKDIANGGAALTAYGKLQYTDMNEIEITELREGLLKYCELDTLAMVMIFEHFLEICSFRNET